MNTIIEDMYKMVFVDSYQHDASLNRGMQNSYGDWPNEKESCDGYFDWGRESMMNTFFLRPTDANA